MLVGQEVSRCRTQRWIWEIYCMRVMKHASQGSTMALNLRVDVIRVCLLFNARRRGSRKVMLSVKCVCLSVCPQGPHVTTYRPVQTCSLWDPPYTHTQILFKLVHYVAHIAIGRPSIEGLFDCKKVQCTGVRFPWCLHTHTHIRTKIT